MNCPCAHAATRRRPGCAGSHSAHSVRASRGPLQFNCSGSAKPPLRVRRHRPPSHLRWVPGMPHGCLLHTGASHRVLRHLREASLACPTRLTSLEPRGGPFDLIAPGRQSLPCAYARPRAPRLRRVPGCGIGYVMGVFWYFLSLVTKSTAFTPPMQPDVFSAQSGPRPARRQTDSVHWYAPAAR